MLVPSRKVNVLDRVARSTQLVFAQQISRCKGSRDGERGGEFRRRYLNRIHCGTGRFWRAALANLTFVRKDLLDGIVDGEVCVQDDLAVSEKGLSAVTCRPEP
jgi:hypothetical protein